MAFVCVCDSDDDGDGNVGPFRNVELPQERPAKFRDKGPMQSSVVASMSLVDERSVDSHADRVEAMRLASMEATRQLPVTPLSKLAAARLTRNATMPPAPPPVHRTVVSTFPPRCSTMGSSRSGQASSCTSFAAVKRIVSPSPDGRVQRQVSPMYASAVDIKEVARQVRSPRPSAPAVLRQPSCSSVSQAGPVVIATTEGGLASLPPSRVQRQQSVPIRQTSNGLWRSMSVDAGIASPRQHPARMQSCASFTQAAPITIRRSPSGHNSPSGVSSPRAGSFVVPPVTGLVSPRGAEPLLGKSVLDSLAVVARAAVAPDAKAGSSVSVSAVSRRSSIGSVAGGSFVIGRGPSAGSGMPPPTSSGGKGFSPFWQSPTGAPSSARAASPDAGGAQRVKHQSPANSFEVNSPLNGVLGFTQAKGLDILGRGVSVDNEMSEEEEPPPDVPLDVVIKRLNPAPPLVHASPVESASNKQPLLAVAVAPNKQPVPRRSAAGKMFWKPPPEAAAVCEAAPAF